MTKEQGPPAPVRLRRAAVRTYHRPMAGWWRHRPVFIAYMLREATAVFLCLYALVLLAGLACLVLGPAAWNAWLALLRTPVSLLLHALGFAAACWHSLSWFQVMPKTAPDLPLPAHWISIGAAILALLLSIATWLLLAGHLP